jgi:hypothetical protein
MKLIRFHPFGQVATGEVFLGGEAMQRGLVDRLATSDEAGFAGGFEAEKMEFFCSKNG